MSEILKSKHAFGPEANVGGAIQQWLIDEYDIIFFNEGKLGWLDKNKQLIMLKIPQAVQTVTSLPSAGEKDTIYICGQMLYFWNENKFIPVIAGGGNGDNAGGITQGEVEAMIEIAKSQAQAYTDNRIAGTVPQMIIQQLENTLVVNSTAGGVKPFATFVTNKNMLDSISIKDGQLIFIEDKKTVALDNGGKRVMYTGVIEVASDVDRLAVTDGIDGTMYYVRSTSELWMYMRTNWLPLITAKTDPTYIGGALPETGIEGVIYVNKIMKTISVWDDGIRDYVVVGNTGLGGDGELEENEVQQLMERISIARENAVATAKEYTNQQISMAEISISALADEKIQAVQEEVDRLKEENSANDQQIDTMATTVQRHTDALGELEGRVTQLEENGSGGGGSITVTAITDEEIDALFKVY